ncbi:MAG: DUF3179 domain-containing protein [Acidimicrobiia bacterium]|nr:DUF3179 domain-containing protein [Acidimicrobiia bacterium]
MGRGQRRHLIAGIAISSVMFAACAASGDEGAIDEARTALDETVAFATKDWDTDWANATIDLDELLLGIGATEPRDAIAPIDEPKYETPDDAADWLSDREPGALVQVNGDVRFFPLSIMTRHEIVNDEIGGVPVAVTYCPLCNTALSFDRRVDGAVLRFGVSGLLRNSDLVMWDDRTVSLWQQITGEALVGAHAGTRLQPISTAIVRFGDFRSGFPGGRSLTRDTGFEITYGANRYVDYSDRFAPMIPVEGERDNRFPALERVVGVSVGGAEKAYPFSVLRAHQVVNDVVGGIPVAVLWGSPDTADALDAKLVADGDAIGTAIAFDPTVDDRVLTLSADGDTFSDAETNSTWTILGQAVSGPLAGTQLETVTHRNEFWFAWTAFFPDAAVYGS